MRQTKKKPTPCKRFARCIVQKIPCANYMLLTFLLVLRFASASEAPQNAQATADIRVFTRLTLLDVNAFDAKGVPVAGLSAKDFLVFEDGKPQPLRSFDAAEGHSLPESSRSKGITLDPSHPEEFARAPVTILVLDETNTRATDAAFGLRSLRKFLLRQPEFLPQAAELLAVSNARFELLQGFTADRDLLLKRLDEHRPSYPWKLAQSTASSEPIAERLDQTLAAIEQIVANSAALKTRKNLVWVGAGFPTPDPNALTVGTADQLKNGLQHLTDLMLDARVALFIVDPTSTAAGMLEVSDETQLEFLSAAAEGGARLSDPFAHSFDFDRLASVSGGLVIRGANNADALIDQSIRQGNSYYTLGYEPTDTTFSAHQFRKIRVQCTRPGVTLLSRQGYYTSPPTELLAKRDTVRYDLNNAATAAIPYTALAVSVAGSGSSFSLHVQSTGLQWKSGSDGELTAQVQIAAVALSAAGKILGHKLQTMNARAAAATAADSIDKPVPFAIVFEAPKATARLRFIVRDSGNGHMGTADISPITK